MKVYGLKELGRKIPELLKKDVKDRYDPDKWNWKPYDPEKIKNIREVIAAERAQTYYAVITNYSPARRKQKVVLVFSMGNLTYSLLNHFDTAGILYYYIDYVQFMAKAGEVVVQIESGELIAEICIDNLILNLRDVEFVIWTPPLYPIPFFDNKMIPPRTGRNRYLFDKRWQSLVCSLELILANATWLPGKPSKGSQDWQNKLGEYYLAMLVGLKIPPTIFTNSSDRIKLFFEGEQSILLREFSCPPYSFPPVHVDLQRATFLHLEKAPCTFQKYIGKKFEYRVVVFFDEVFAFRIHSQDSALTQHDWRVHDDANVKWEVASLPEEIEQKLTTLRTHLQLNWMSVDLIETPDNEFYFLEANRPGAHYWLSMFVGFDITEKIAQHIKSSFNG